MKQKEFSPEEHAFALSVEQLVRTYKEKVSPGKAREIVDDILTRWKEQIEKSSEWTRQITSEVVRPIVPLEEGGEARNHAMPAVQIVADTRELLESILHQILQVGAILIELDPAPALNDTVLVGLNFPDAHLQVETKGRVVHRSGQGTAIELSGLAQEDRLSLQAVRDDLEQKKDREKNDVGRTYPGIGPSVLNLEAAPVENVVDPTRSFAHLGGRGAGQRLMVPATMRRRFELPDPDMKVAESSPRRQDPAASAREFYGPGPKWLNPGADPDRVEQLVPERVLDILLQLSENGFSGVLEFQQGNVKEQYLYDSGYVVERATQPRITEEELGPMLKAAEKITKQQLAMAAAHADELGLPIARSLLELDILSPDVLRNAIAGRLTFLLRELCNQSSGQVCIYDARTLPVGFLPQPPLRVHVAVERVIYERIYRQLNRLNGEQRDRRMENVVDASPEIIEHERDRFERAVTSPEQVRFVERVLTGRKRLREVLTESPLSPAETFAVVFSLHRMGLLRFDHSLHVTVVRERLREDVTVKYLSVHKASYFEVLNVHWSSYSEVIEKAYRDLCEQFDPASVPDELEEEVHQRVKEINERVEAAYAALSKRSTRHAYRTRIMPEYKLAHAIPLFMKQCGLAERRGKWGEARDALLRVLEIEPEHIEGKRRLDRINQIISGSLSPDPADTNF